MIRILVTEGVTVMTGLFENGTTGPFGSGAELRFELTFEDSSSHSHRGQVSAYFAHLHQHLDHQHPHYTIDSQELKERATPQTLLQWAHQQLPLFFQTPEDFGRLKELRTSVRLEGLSWSLQL